MPQDRQIGKIPQSPIDALKRGTNYLFAIGINQYAHFTHLSNARKDVEDMAEVLVNDYYFERPHIHFLCDEAATRANIIKGLDALSKKLKADDRLLIYYSGHGLLDGKRGFWIPVNAERDNVATYIANAEVRDIIQSIEARHVLLISDSCFSANLLVRDATRDASGAFTTWEQNQSRWIFISGKGVVSDGKAGENSPFAKAILKHLRQNKAEALNIVRLADNVTTEVRFDYAQQAELSPLYQSGHEGGQFVFLKRQTEKDDWQAALVQNTEGGYLAYLNQYPNGEFAKEADQKLEDIADAKEWRIATMRDAAFAYRQYLRNYPQGTHAHEAQAKLDLIAEEERRGRAEREAERLAKVEADKKEAERLAKIEADKRHAEHLAKLEADRKEAERLAKIEADKRHAEHLAKLEADRKEAERLAKIEADKRHAEQLAKMEADRKEVERLAKIEADRKEAERLAKLEADKKEAERLIQLETERKEAEQFAASLLDIEAAKKEIEQQRLEKERVEQRQRLERTERLEYERVLKLEADKKEAERLEKEKTEQRERLEKAERLEQQRLAKIEADKKEQQRLAKLEVDRKEAERVAKLLKAQQAAETPEPSPFQKYRMPIGIGTGVVATGLLIWQLNKQPEVPPKPSPIENGGVQPQQPKPTTISEGTSAVPPKETLSEKKPDAPQPSSTKSDAKAAADKLAAQQKEADRIAELKKQKDAYEQKRQAAEAADAERRRKEQVGKTPAKAPVLTEDPNAARMRQEQAAEVERRRKEKEKQEMLTKVTDILNTALIKAGDKNKEKTLKYLNDAGNINGLPSSVGDMINLAKAKVEYGEYSKAIEWINKAKAAL